MKGDISPEKARQGQASYPAAARQEIEGRKTWPLTSQWRLSQFGVNMVELSPGSWSTQRHCTGPNDELVVVISGELTLVTDDGEEVLRAGDCVGFKAGVPNAIIYRIGAASRLSTMTLAGAIPGTSRLSPTSDWKLAPTCRSSFARLAGRNDAPTLLFPDASMDRR